MRILSWRRHSLTKLFLGIADLTSGLGFRLDRLGVVVAGSILPVAVIAPASANVGLIVPKPAANAPPATARMLRDTARSPTCAERLEPDTGVSKKEVLHYDRCPGLVYAIDLLSPVDLHTQEFMLNEYDLKQGLKTSRLAFRSCEAPGEGDPPATLAHS